MIIISLSKAKDISHVRRRIKRDREFKPLDIKSTIPNESVKAEIDRKNVREKYEKMQVEIDSASTIDELQEILT